MNINMDRGQGKMRILNEGEIKKTRKVHQCCVCGEFIEKGSSCYWQTNTYDGIGTAYWHLYCDPKDCYDP